MLPDEQTFTGNIGIDIAVARGNILQLRDKVLTLFSRLLRNVLFERHVDGSDGCGAGQRVATCRRGMNERVAIHDAPDFGRGHERANRHHTASQRFGRGDNIRLDIPVFYSPQLTRAAHTRLHFVGDEQYFVFITDLTQARPEIIRRHNRARLTLDRLHDNGGDIVAHLARDAQLLLYRVGVTERHVENIVLRRHGRAAEDGLTG